MSGISLNPGTGPVHGSDQSQALTNMDALVADVNAVAVPTRQVSLDSACVGEDEGRYTFMLTHANGAISEVDMPGLPLAQVRYVGDPEQNIWDFPRLYVDGSSWVWKYAINILATDGDTDED